jgi:hypothetical protein
MKELLRASSRRTDLRTGMYRITEIVRRIKKLSVCMGAATCAIFGDHFLSRRKMVTDLVQQEKGPNTAVVCQKHYCPKTVSNPLDSASRRSRSPCLFASSNALIRSTDKGSSGPGKSCGKVPGMIFMDALPPSPFALPLEPLPIVGIGPTRMSRGWCMCAA